MTSSGDTSIRVLILDLDGTVLSSRGMLEQRTAEAIQHASERGIHVVFASARPLWSIRELTTAVGPAHYVGAGGAVVADPDGVILAHRPLAEDVLRRVIAVLDETGVPALLYRGALTMRHGDSPAIRAEAVLTSKNQRLPPWDGGSADKLLAIADDPTQLVGELERVPVSVTTSHASYVEVSAVGVDKAQASEVVLPRIHEDWPAVMAIGDGDNDVCLLRKAGYGVTLEAGPPSAREAANRIVGTNDDGSVASAIKGLAAKEADRRNDTSRGARRPRQRNTSDPAPLSDEGQQ